MFKENQSGDAASNTIIGASVNVEGEFEGKGDVIIEGKLKGSVKTQQNITIGQNAVVNAEVSCANAFVAGKVVGNISTSGKLELTKTAKIKGNIMAKELSIESGAIFNGSCNMEPESQKAPEEETKDK